MRGIGLLGQGLARRIVLRRDIELLHQRERLVVHRSMIAHHLLGKGEDLRVFRFLQSLFASFNIE